jgi:cellulose synthase/poly-beta-1,6-N-acetylglucosamine synthase-like glycosyltransferase
LAYATLILPFVLIPYFPDAVIIFMLLYIFLWFLRAIEYSYFLLYAYFQYRKALKVDWLKKQDQIPKTATVQPQDVIHLIIVPTYKESFEVLEESIRSIAESNFQLQNVWVSLATEERDAKNGRKNAELLQKRFAGVFGRFLWSEHPADLPNEIKGKGGNITFAAREAVVALKEAKVELERVLVTTVDADNIFHPDLLNCLTYHYSVEPNRHKKAFQPIPLFFNNIWEVPIINRVVALSSSYWHLIESGRPDRLRNFSSHSQPLSALVDMDFWDRTTIVEDGRQYWRSYLHFDGDYEVIPVFLPIFQDAILNQTLVRSLVGQFHQLRRWAWGSSDVAYMAIGIREKGQKLPLWRTVLQVYRLVEGVYMWATAAFFLAIVVPIIRIYNDSVNETVLGIHFSALLSNIFAIALCGIFVSMILTFVIVPAPPRRIGRLSVIYQWILLPIATVLFGSFPAIVSQTHLALGRSMEFNVTEKVRKH